MKTHAELAQGLDAQRKATGLSFNRLGQLAYELLGAYCPTTETLRTYHDPERIPERVDLVVVSALAEIYGVKVRDLSASTFEDVKRVSDLLRRQSRCTARSLAAA